MLIIPSVFTDNMVLQREKEISVWGFSDSSVTVTLEIHSDYGTETLEPETLIPETLISEKLQIETDKSSKKWLVKLPAMKAGGPYSLIISNETESVSFANVMIGEVWLAGGQSNMEFMMQQLRDAENEMSKADDSLIRFYFTPKYAYECEELDKALLDSKWMVAKPENVKEWSAVGYYFAKKLREELGCAVGIIGCNWGGTSAACWVSREYLETEEDLSDYLISYDKAVEGLDENEYNAAWAKYEVFQAEFSKKVDEYYRDCAAPNWAEADKLFGPSQYPGPMGPRNFTRPYGLYHTMLKRLAPYSLRGFIFYQGEEDGSRPYTYETLLKLLIRQWRADFRDDGLYFYTVQLPGFLGEGDIDYKNWPFIRESQMKAVSDDPYADFVVAFDQGFKYDIHPTVKKYVGARLANKALLNTYGRDIAEIACGPEYDSYKIDENDKTRMIISVKNLYGGFILRDYCLEKEESSHDVSEQSSDDTRSNFSCQKYEAGMSVEGFEIAGEDRIYHAANVVIDGDRIILSSDAVNEPYYARYGWTNYMDVRLFGGNGLPLAPFRTSSLDGSEVAC